MEWSINIGISISRPVSQSASLGKENEACERGRGKQGGYLICRLANFSIIMDQLASLLHHESMHAIKPFFSFSFPVNGRRWNEFSKDN